MATPNTAVPEIGAAPNTTPQALAQRLRNLVGQLDIKSGLSGGSVGELVEAAAIAAEQLEALTAPATQQLNIEKKTGLERIFAEAMAWGFVYGPVIAREQWDEMRDKMGMEYTSRAAALLHEVSPLQAIPAPVLDWYRAAKAHQHAVEAYNARVDFVKQSCPFGTSVNEEFQAMVQAVRNADALIPAMLGALEDLFSTPATATSAATSDHSGAHAAQAYAVERALAVGGYVVPANGDHGSPVLLYPGQLVDLLDQAGSSPAGALDAGLAAAEHSIRSHEAAGWHGSSGFHSGLTAAANLVRGMRESTNSPSVADAE